MNNQKPLIRDLDHKMVAGVCAGLARYFSVDINLMRLICAVLMLAYPVLIFVYLLLIFILPAEKTYTENFVSAPPSDNVDMVEETENVRDEAQGEGNILLGILLITAGVIFLFDQYFRWIGWKELWPLILILLGIYLLWDAVKNKPAATDEQVSSGEKKDESFDASEGSAPKSDNDETQNTDV